MIKLFISDIDGCVAEPYTPYDLDALQTLARYAAEAGPPGSTRRPALSLCSGRAYPYVEAVTQLLGLQTPVLFESGGGMFDPVTAQVTWSPAFTDDVERQLEEVRDWMLRECLPGTSLMFDYGKRTQRGIAGADQEEIAAAVPRIKQRVADHYPDLVAYETHISVDVLAEGITKREALVWLGDLLGVRLGEMAFIGDTRGDLVALEAVGFPFAPANAAPVVRERIEHVTEGAVTDGVLEAYRWCLAYNEQPVSEAARTDGAR